MSTTIWVAQHGRHYTCRVDRQDQYHGRVLKLERRGVVLKSKEIDTVPTTSSQFTINDVYAWSDQCQLWMDELKQSK